MRVRDVRTYPGFGFFTLVFFLYLYLPIIVVVAYSFNEGRIMAIWRGLSFRWYASALRNDALIDAVQVSLGVAAIATAFATCIALAAALALTRGKQTRYRRLSETIVSLPLLLPEVVLAVAILVLFSELGLQYGPLKLVLAHTCFCIPFAFLPIRARLEGMEANLEEAAQDLYASRWMAFRRVTLPLLMPAVFAGAMLAFVISMDDFITSNVLSGAGATTLPVYIFSLVRQGVSPELNAISTLIMILSLTIATLAFFVLRRRPS